MRPSGISYLSISTLSTSHPPHKKEIGIKFPMILNREESVGYTEIVPSVRHLQSTKDIFFDLRWVKIDDLRKG